MGKKSTNGETQREVLALIPARAGSQRVKSKNIRKLAGKPLIAYTIEAALKAKRVDRVVVSTDSERIAKVARSLGAEAPFLRPNEIAGSASTELEFHLHALEWLAKHENYVPELIVNLYPTSPFRKAVTIDAAIDFIRRHPEADSLRSVRKCSEHPYKMWKKTGNKTYLEPFVPSKKRGSQTLSYHLLPEVFIQNASIYITRPTTLFKQGSTTGKKVLCFEMSERESVDINTPLDFLFAESLLN